MKAIVKNIIYPICATSIFINFVYAQVKTKPKSSYNVTKIVSNTNNFKIDETENYFLVNTKDNIYSAKLYDIRTLKFVQDWQWGKNIKLSDGKHLNFQDYGKISLFDGKGNQIYNKNFEPITINGFNVSLPLYYSDEYKKAIYIVNGDLWSGDFIINTGEVKNLKQNTTIGRIDIDNGTTTYIKDSSVPITIFENVVSDGKYHIDLINNKINNLPKGFNIKHCSNTSPNNRFLEGAQVSSDGNVNNGLLDMKNNTLILFNNKYAFYTHRTPENLLIYESFWVDNNKIVLMDYTNEVVNYFLWDIEQKKITKNFQDFIREKINNDVTIYSRKSVSPNMKYFLSHGGHIVETQNFTSVLDIYSQLNILTLSWLGDDFFIYSVNSNDLSELGTFIYDISKRKKIKVFNYIIDSDPLFFKNANCVLLYANKRVWKYNINNGEINSINDIKVSFDNFEAVVQKF